MTIPLRILTILLCAALGLVHPLFFVLAGAVAVGGLVDREEADRQPVDTSPSVSKRPKQIGVLDVVNKAAEVADKLSDQIEQHEQTAIIKRAVHPPLRRMEKILESIGHRTIHQMEIYEKIGYINNTNRIEKRNFFFKEGAKKTWIVYTNDPRLNHDRKISDDLNKIIKTAEGSQKFSIIIESTVDKHISFLSDFHSKLFPEVPAFAPERSSSLQVEAVTEEMARTRLCEEVRRFALAGTGQSFVRHPYVPPCGLLFGYWWDGTFGGGNDELTKGFSREFVVRKASGRRSLIGTTYRSTTSHIMTHSTVAEPASGICPSDETRAQNIAQHTKNCSEQPFAEPSCDKVANGPEFFQLIGRASEEQDPYEYENTINSKDPNCSNLNNAVNNEFATPYYARSAPRDQFEKKTYSDQIRVPHLVHFTRCENLKSIMHNGLVSRCTGRELGLDMHKNDQLRLDDRLNAISLSISFPNYKMFYKHRIENAHSDWAVLILCRSVLWEKQCGFFKHNAADSRMRRRSPEDIERVTAFRDMFATSDELPRESWMRSYDPTDPQAEVMVFEPIEATNIETVAFETKEVTEKWSRFLGGTDFIYAGTGNGLFGTRQKVRQN